MKNPKNKITIGIDEVGRGPLAGPLVVCAVAVSEQSSIDGLNDSKKLTPKQRALLVAPIKQCALGIGMGWVHPHVLDKIGMTSALRLAAGKALSQLPKEILSLADVIYTDGTISFVDDAREITLPKADAKIRAVSAASIIAKEARDSYMTELAKLYPVYGFERHAGYGTTAHRQAIAEHGYIVGVHRESFAPIKNMAASRGLIDDRPVDKTTGRQAEQLVASRLMDDGYVVIAQNWRTKRCEIDIVATKNNQYYFVEVKYRENNIHGDGLEAITPRKLKQMQLAAITYLHYFGLDQTLVQPNLLVASVSGNPMTIEQLLPLDVL